MIFSQVWDETSPWIEDYVIIPVGSVIEPEDDLTVGDVVCFTSSLLTDEGKEKYFSFLYFSLSKRLTFVCY